MSKLTKTGILYELSELVNRSQDYVILRNHEELSNGTLLLEGHEDIDLLVDNAKSFYQHNKIKRRYWYQDYIHGEIFIDNQKIKMDIRQIGDGYYDKAWEQNMLLEKIMDKSGFYTMNSENYFYSLIYHAILQKKHFSEDYRMRLIEMSACFLPSKKTAEFTEKDWIDSLEDWMLKKGYKATYPYDTQVPLRFYLLNRVKKRGFTLWIIRKIVRLPKRILTMIINRIKGGRLGRKAQSN